MIELPKEVRPVVLTKEKLTFLWDKLKQYDVLFSDDSRWDKEKFVERLADSRLVLLEVNDGIIFIEGIVPGQLAQIHACMWDHKLSPRTGVLRRCLQWAFDIYGLERIEAFIPHFCQSLRRFLKNNLSFTEEGTLRRFLMYKEKMIDVIALSILKEEAVWDNKRK